MAEKDFQRKLAAGMGLVPGIHYHKIADVPVQAMQAAMRDSGVQLKLRSPKKPYDCFALHQCLYVAMELKQTRGMSLPSKAVEDHQEEALLQVEANGGVGLVVVNFQLQLSAKEQKKRGLTEIDVAYAAPISAVVSARDSLSRDSVPLTWWEEHGWPLERKGATKWDPRAMLVAARQWRMGRPL